VVPRDVPAAIDAGAAGLARADDRTSEAQWREVVVDVTCGVLLESFESGRPPDQTTWVSIVTDVIRNDLHIAPGSAPWRNLEVVKQRTIAAITPDGEVDDTTAQDLANQVGCGTLA
jgi:hypothetical protein